MVFKPPGRNAGAFALSLLGYFESCIPHRALLLAHGSVSLMLLVDAGANRAQGKAAGADSGVDDELYRHVRVWDIRFFFEPDKLMTR